MMGLFLNHSSGMLIYFIIVSTLELLLIESNYDFLFAAGKFFLYKARAEIHMHVQKCT